MKSSIREIEDIVDLVQQEPGWRVEHTRRGWQIFPPDRALPIIQASGTSTDLHAPENLRAQLRRSGFTPLMRTIRKVRSDDMPATTNGKTPGLIPAPSLLPPPPPPAPLARNLVREARVHIQTALDALSSIDQLLGEIEGERDQIQRLKEMFASVLK